MREKSTSQHDAIAELAKDIQDRFKKWSKQYRRGVWDAITSKKGEELIDRWINSPGEPIINKFRNLSFKEWMETTAMSPEYIEGVHCALNDLSAASEDWEPAHCPYFKNKDKQKQEDWLLGYRVTMKQHTQRRVAGK